MGRRLKEIDYFLAWLAFTASVVAVAVFVMPVVRASVEGLLGFGAAYVTGIVLTVCVSYAVFRFVVRSMIVGRVDADGHDGDRSRPLT